MIYLYGSIFTFINIELINYFLTSLYILTPNEMIYLYCSLFIFINIEHIAYFLTI